MRPTAGRFAENRIDFSVLPDLTDQDLKDLGVVLGDRRKMLRAIAELGNKPIAAATVGPPAEVAGERRHATVMFCDLVDSTGLAEKLDAEEWRDLVGAYLDAASAAVTEMGGQVAKELGDGLMALFGYPVAQENDAERAVRAALSIQRALAELNRKIDAVDPAHAKLQASWNRSDSNLQLRGMGPVFVFLGGTFQRRAERIQTQTEETVPRGGCRGTAEIIKDFLQIEI